MNPPDDPPTGSADPSPDSAGRARLAATVSGHVQGVGFRYFVLRQAEQYGLTGWVANAPDGTVEVLAEGPRGRLDWLAEALADGPSGAHVTNVDLRWSPATGTFDRFGVRSGGHSGD